MNRYFTYLITNERNLEDTFFSLFSELNDEQVIGKRKSVQNAKIDVEVQSKCVRCVNN